MQSKESETIWSIVWVRFSPKRQFLDESRCSCLCMECWWSTPAGCCVFTLSHSFVLQLVTCEGWFYFLFLNFSQNSHAQLTGRLANTPSSSLFKLLLDSSQPPVYNNPLPSNSKGPHPKLGRRNQAMNVFHKLCLSQFICVTVFVFRFHISCQWVNLQAEWRLLDKDRTIFQFTGNTRNQISTIWHVQLQWEIH